MRVADVRLEGFGRLKNRSFRFAPGLNLLYGPNESGKSTLQQALLALLYGLDDQGPGGADLLASFRPWDANAYYAGSLTYVLDDGRAFRVARRFGPQAEASLRTHPTGEDVTARFQRSPREGVSFASEHWGLSRPEFEVVCVARQANLIIPASVASTLTGLLQNRLASAPLEAGAARAISLLEEALRERIGTTSDRAGPLPEATANLVRLEEERRQVVEARSALLPQLAALAQADLRLAELSAERQRLLAQAEAEIGMARTPPAAVAQVAAEVRRSEAELARWQVWAEFPAHLRDEVLKLSAQRTRLQEECAEVERRGQRAEQALREIEVQEAALKERLATMGGQGRATADDLGRVQELASEWRMASELEWSANERCRAAKAAFDSLEQSLSNEDRVLEVVAPTGVAGLAAVQKRLQQARQRLAAAKGTLSEASSAWARLGLEEAEFQRLEAAVQNLRAVPKDRPGRNLLSVILNRSEPVEQAPPGLALHSQAQPLYAELLRSRTEVEAAQRALSDVEAATLWQLGSLLGGTLDESAFTQLAERLERHLRVRAELDQQRITIAGLLADQEQARLRSQKAERALQGALGKLGFPGPDVHKALTAYVKQRESRYEAPLEDADQARLRLRTEVDLELLHVRAEVQRGELQNWKDRQAALVSAETKLAALLAQAGGAGPAIPLDAALLAFEEGVANHRRWEKANLALETAMRYQRVLWDGPLPAEGARGPAGGGRQESAAQASARAEAFRRLEEQWLQASQTRDELAARLAAAEEDLRHLAEIDEEIAATQASIRSLLQFRDGLQLARDELLRASREYQMQYGPKLQALLKDGLSRTMPKGYGDVTIDPDRLDMALAVPERKGAVPVGHLSASARELACLLLRISIARLMGLCGERLPLLLDGPLPHCDYSRQEQALDYLAYLAETFQVLFFTSEERLRTRFGKKLEHSPLHQVHVLEGA